MAEFCSARSNTISPPQWTTFAPPFTLLYSIAPTLIVTANDSAREYGDANAFTASITGFIDGDTQSSATSGTAALTSAGIQSSDTGTYAINAALGTLASDFGYQFTTFNNGTLTINKAPLSVALAQSVYSRSQGTANPIFGLNYSGFKLGETASVLDTLPTASTAAGTTSPGGQYAITLAGGFDNNYDFLFTNPAGFLTVENSVALPSVWEGQAYGNESQTGNQIFTASNTNFVPSAKLLVPSQISFIVSSENNTAETDQNTQSEGGFTEDSNSGDDKLTGENSEISGLKIIIDATLARSLGLTQKMLNAFLQ